MSNFIRNDRELARKILTLLNGQGVPFNPHVNLEPDDPADIELGKLTDHIARLSEMGIPRKSITGADHHVFYTHAEPVWQSFRTLLKQGMIHDFGGSTLSNFDLFPYFFCTSAAYRPYCAPFLLEDAEGNPEPFVIWSPAPAFPGTGIGFPPGYYAFSRRLRWLRYRYSTVNPVIKGVDYPER